MALPILISSHYKYRHNKKTKNPFFVIPNVQQTDTKSFTNTDKLKMGQGFKTLIVHFFFNSKRDGPGGMS